MPTLPFCSDRCPSMAEVSRHTLSLLDVLLDAEGQPTPIERIEFRIVAGPDGPALRVTIGTPDDESAWSGEARPEQLPLLIDVAEGLLEDELHPDWE